MELKDLTRDMFLFAATVRERLENEHGLAAHVLGREVAGHFASMDRNAGKHPTLEARYKQVRYALVGLIDEIVVTSTWSQADQWELLEMNFYGTSIAGDRIYDLLAAFNASEADLTEQFFYVLALGFRGRLALDEDKWIAILDETYRRLPNVPDRGDFQLAPEAYRVIKRKSQRLDPLFSLGRSVLIFVVCLLVLFVFYKVAWNDVVKRADAKSVEVATKLQDDELRRELLEVQP